MRSRRSGVAGLVQRQLATPRNRERRQPTPRLVANRTSELDAVLLQLLDGRFDVVAHQIELIAAVILGRIGRELGGRQSEDQPSSSGGSRARRERTRAHPSGSGVKMIACAPVITDQPYLYGQPGWRDLL